MSIHVSSDVWDYSTASGTTLLILVWLADKAHDDGVSWWSVPHIAKACRTSERSVQRALTWLAEHNEITLETRPGTSSIVTVTIGRTARRGDKLSGRQDVTGDIRDAGGDKNDAEGVTDCRPKRIYKPKIETSLREPSPDDDDDALPLAVVASVEKMPKTGNGRKLPKQPLPDDWKPNEGHERFARENDLDVEFEAASFRAYNLAHDIRFVRWDQAFTNRLLSVVKYRAERRPPTAMWGNGASRPAAQTTVW